MVPRFHLKDSPLQSGTLRNRPFFGLGVTMGSFDACHLFPPAFDPLLLPVRESTRDRAKRAFLRTLALAIGVEGGQKLRFSRGISMARMIRYHVILAVMLSLASIVALAQSSGAATYIPKCAGCHGTNGVVASAYMKSRGTPEATDPYIRSLTDKQMFSSVKNGKEGPDGSAGMPPFKNRLTDAQIRDAVAYFRELGTGGPPLTATDQSKAVEDINAQNAAAIKNNEIIKVLNADLRIVMQDMKDGENAPDAEAKAAKYGEAETLMLRDTQAKPDASVLWIQLGRAQAGLMKYAEAESSLMKALELESAATHPNAQVQSFANTELDKIHARTGVVAGQDVASAPAPSPSPQRRYEDIAPPPPPPAPAPTISMGQTKAQVIVAFGEPQRKAVAGQKEMFFYTDLKMKVTFTNGKVSSID